jgi:hypothetical protein
MHKENAMSFLEQKTLRKSLCRDRKGLYLHSTSALQFPSWGFCLCIYTVPSTAVGCVVRQDSRAKTGLHLSLIKWFREFVSWRQSLSTHQVFIALRICTALKSLGIVYIWAMIIYGTAYDYVTAYKHRMESRRVCAQDGVAPSECRLIRGWRKGHPGRGHSKGQKSRHLEAAAGRQEQFCVSNTFINPAVQQEDIRLSSRKKKWCSESKNGNFLLRLVTDSEPKWEGWLRTRELWITVVKYCPICNLLWWGQEKSKWIQPPMVTTAE